MISNRFAALGAAAALALGTAAPASAADEIRIGMITTLSGSGAGLGIDIRDGFALALEQLGGSLGGLPATVIEGDDERKPDVAVQLASRMIERDEVDVVTGIVWSNLALALMPTVQRNEVFFLSPNAGPSQLAGAQCSPWFFNVAFQNDGQHEAMGQHVQDAGYESVYLLAPNYPAGQDSLTGFKRYYEGEIVGEVYTQIGQLDYAAEIAALRAADPDAVFFFYPGGMGINFVKQYAQAGLKGEIPLFGPGFSFSQDILAAVGEAALGVANSAQWSPDLDIPENREFVASFEEKYGRLPSLYAAQGYEAALLLDSAVAAVEGAIEDKDAFRAALQAADFTSVRGDFSFGNNHYPIQDYYLREVVQDDEGRITNRLVSTIFEDHVDAYAADCPL
ncbi:ABC transporter substrate-binding protein [Inquilinus sp. CAU 1745]|uniref:ABC transporter substrate-binding protein n=1 Tax=Inquilinus sp. CAU 1745 TaxID=3140369 RepID=UPI00325BAAC4